MCDDIFAEDDQADGKGTRERAPPGLVGAGDDPPAPRQERALGVEGGTYSFTSAAGSSGLASWVAGITILPLFSFSFADLPRRSRRK